MPTQEERDELEKRLFDLERQIMNRLPKDDGALRPIWEAVFDRFASNIEVVPDAPGDVRMQGTREDRIHMLWALRPRAIVDGELLVDVVPPAQALTVSLLACLKGLQMQIENVLDRLAFEEETEPLTVRFELRPGLASIRPA